MKVLMLGWEFPPIINGGLGIACLGMGKALSKHVDLSFILPKVDPSFVVDRVQLTGLDHLPLEQVRQITDEIAAPSKTLYETFAEVDRIEADLLPYGAIKETKGRSEIARAETAAKTVPPSRAAAAQIRYATESLAGFAAGELYGDDVHEKVTAFAKASAILADSRDFDLIHVHDWMTFPAGIAIKQRTGKPLVVHVHSPSYDRAGPESRGWIFDVEKSGMEAADLVIPVSEYTGTIVTGHYGIDPAKVVPIHNGAEPVEAYRTEKAFPEKLVLFLGRLTAQKGPEFFLEIAAKVLKENRNVRFVVAGTGEKLKPLIEYGAYHDVGDRFHFTGFLNKQKVNELLSMTDAYCMPSVSEPFGLSALEAAQYGIPAVISKQSGVAEVLTRALQADYWDVDLMAHHIATLLNDDETIGEHKWEDTGIFDFWSQIPEAMAAEGVRFRTSSEVIDTCTVLGIYDVHAPTSWADTAKDLSAWKGNTMQTEATKKILTLEAKVKAINDPDLFHQWSKMQTSDHFYYMCTKGDADGGVHSYFTPYPSPYEGYMYFMNALSDLQIRVDRLSKGRHIKMGKLETKV